MACLNVFAGQHVFFDDDVEGIIKIVSATYFLPCRMIPLIICHEGIMVLGILPNSLFVTSLFLGMRTPSF